MWRGACPLPVGHGCQNHQSKKAIYPVPETICHMLDLSIGSSMVTWVWVKIGFQRPGPRAIFHFSDPKPRCLSLICWPIPRSLKCPCSLPPVVLLATGNPSFVVVQNNPHLLIVHPLFVDHVTLSWLLNLLTKMDTLW